MTAIGILRLVATLRAKKCKNSSFARHYDQIRFRFCTPERGSRSSSAVSTEPKSRLTLDTRVRISAYGYIMASKHPSNPLALAVLALVFERPMHPYEMASVMKQRHKHDSIKLR